MRRLALVIVACTACDPASPAQHTAAPSPASSASPTGLAPAASASTTRSSDPQRLPRGWWVVVENHFVERFQSAAFRFTTDGYTMVATDARGAQRSDRRVCRWMAGGPGWKCEGALPFSLVEEGPRLRLSFAADAGDLVLGPASTEEVTQLDEAARRLAQPKNVCDRAERCCVAAFELLDATCDVEVELGGKQSAEQCQRSLAGMRIILEQKKLALPDSCRPP